jgi:crotonobetainyl-CoA:carnitine CoA-transferase CaiB-like acyl-CoA transferase
VPSRRANFAELKRVMLETGRHIADANAFEEQFSHHQLAVGVLRDARELADTEWAAARGAIREVSDRGGGTIRIPSPPWHFSEAEVGGRGEPRFRGEDNRAVLAELLGYDDATIDAFEADGVLSSRVPSSGG